MTALDHLDAAVADADPAEVLSPLAMSLTPMVVLRMRELRRARKWSAAELGRRLAAVGVALGREVIANLESGRREHVSVDELRGLGEVFGVDPWSLTSPDARCPHCLDCPPAGFACTTCGNTGPR